MNKKANAWLREGYIVQQQYNLLSSNINNNQVSLLANLDQHKHAEGYAYLEYYSTEFFNDNRSEYGHYKIVINGGSIFAFS